MKLRIQGDSLRLRVAPSDVDRLLKEGRVAETVHFTQAADARLTYALECTQALLQPETISVRYATQEVAVLVPTAMAKHWAEGAEVGLYGHAPVAGGLLEIAVEKDFACIDKSDAENKDTFPNPKQGAVC
jgi:hypothetical protein